MGVGKSIGNNGPKVSSKIRGEAFLATHTFKRMMKRTSTVVSVIALSVAPLAVYAGLALSNDAEFLRLREKRDRALATGAEAINADYRASLERLLKRAVAQKDKETAAKIQFELQSLNAAGTSSRLPDRIVTETPEMTALKKAVSETKWRIDNDKTFMLHADGSSTSSWTPRKGHWKVIDATTLELDIGNIPRHQKVTVSEGVTVMTWLDREVDQLHSEVAKKIVPHPN